jgi:hypothetical protein
MTGMASPQIRKVLNEAIETVISADARAKIRSINANGDEGYGSNFILCFSKIKLSLAQRGDAEKS